MIATKLNLKSDAAMPLIAPLSSGLALTGGARTSQEIVYNLHAAVLTLPRD